MCPRGCKHISVSVWVCTSHLNRQPMTNALTNTQYIHVGTHRHSMERAACACTHTEAYKQRLDLTWHEVSAYLCVNNAYVYVANDNACV